MHKKTKSPLKNNPLRTPGQSLDEEIQRVLEDDVTLYMLFPLLFILLTIWTWLIWYEIIQRTNPILLTIITIALSTYCAFKLVKIKKHLKLLKLGRDGERAVGQSLDTLKRRGCRVFHDFVGDGFNLDHVIICEKGAFTVETKTRSKPTKEPCEINYNDDGISINGYISDNKILIQAMAQKKWLEKTIAELTGIKLSVIPVVLFPGWYVKDNRVKKRNNVWVLELKALFSFIDKQPNVISEEQVRLVANHLSLKNRATYIRKLKS